MKKTIFTILTAAFAMTASAQTFVGSVNANLNLVQLASNEYAYYLVENDTLRLLNTDLSSKQSIAIPSHINSRGRVSQISRHLFDMDNNIEFVTIYFDTVSNVYADVAVVDNGIKTSLPNLNFNVGESRLNSIIDNLGSGSQLLIWQLGMSNYLLDKTTVYDLPGQALSVKEYELTEQELYPNPGSEIVRVPVLTGETVQVFDMGGKLLKQEQSKGPGHVLQVNDLPSGSYVVHGSNGGSWKFVKK